MSNPQNVRTLADSPEAAPGATTTFVRADPRPSAEGYADLQPQLRAQLRELQLRTGTATPDIGLLLRLVNDHYQRIETERRGIAESMALMAAEARALEHTAREQGSEHLQVILDHIKDVVLSVEEDGTLRTFNPTGERVFGYTEAEVVGQRIELLIPEITIAESETVPQALQRLAASTGDTALDLVGRELWARRKDGESFPAEIAVSKAPLARREMFVLCLRDVSERRESEQAMRESAARYRLLVDHAPEAIVVLDVDTGRFMDANDKAQKLFGLDRAKLLEVGPVTLSPPYQPDGGASEQRARLHPAGVGGRDAGLRVDAPRRARTRDHLRGAPRAAAERQTPAGARQHRRHLRAQACRAHGQRRAQSVRAGDPQRPAPRGAGVDHAAGRVGRPRHRRLGGDADRGRPRLRLHRGAAASGGAAHGARALEHRHPLRLLRGGGVPRAPGVGGRSRQGSLLARAPRSRPRRGAARGLVDTHPGGRREAPGLARGVP